jgi:hypothetical protein
MRRFITGLLILSGGVILMNCGDKKPSPPQTSFTKADSLTDRYLAYQDSILRSWNIMINDDNQKIKAMHNLMHELLITNADDRDQLRAFEHQLNRLTSMRYTQKSMGDEEVVEAYDFAVNALVSELLSLAESKAEFTYNTTLQKLVEDIRLADQRVNNYRENYDYIVLEYNNFLESNNSYLQEMNLGDSMSQKHLFKMASSD